jgi:hypothetical protein
MFPSVRKRFALPISWENPESLSAEIAASASNIFTISIFLKKNVEVFEKLQLFQRQRKGLAFTWLPSKAMMRISKCY